MRMLWAALAVVLTFTLPMEAAHAKRFGGGKSFGRTYQTTPHTAPSPSSPTRADSQPSRQAQPATAPASARKGMMGGLLGGLLAGGLLAALFAGGAFNGIQLMDVLLIAVAVFGVLFILRQMRGAGQGARPAYAGPAGNQARESSFDASAARGDAPIFGQRSGAEAAAPASAVPMNLPQGFDSPAFIEGAKSHYRTLQDAWNRNDLVKIREYCTPELYDQLRVERAMLSAEQHTEILSLDSQLVRADQAFGVADVSIRFSGRYRDAVEGVEEDFVDIWHLERDYGKDGSPWYITGVESR